MIKKYELTDETIQHDGRTLYRIRALVRILSAGVSAGDLGGYVEMEKNLSHAGDCWVGGNARVYGAARVYGDAWVHANAELHGHADVYGHAEVCGDAEVYGMVSVCGDAIVSGGVLK